MVYAIRRGGGGVRVVSKKAPPGKDGRCKNPVTCPVPHLSRSVFRSVRSTCTTQDLPGAESILLKNRLINFNLTL